MSESYLTLITDDPEYVPDAAKRETALSLFTSLFADADELGVRVTNEVEFIHPGGNFECVRCPGCAAECDIDWWLSAMDSAYEKRFTDLAVTMPCCGIESSLNTLAYEGPAGFARFVLEARNPDNDVSNEEKAALERAAGCSLRKVWVRI
jgi:hypothetical protein